ncbi:hypothetical protein LCGC14_1807880 [marine sediment metagenome]|uniref:Uncharacterized protein n=1 Tax=marine sediment metagenome TaxID=412755 RepID=A0A0F9GMI4_9ZZZZ
MDAFTPKPWVCDERADHPTILGDNGHFVAEFGDDEDCYYVLLCVNNHDALLEALKSAHGMLNQSLSHNTKVASDGFFQNIGAVITKAEGGDHG